MLHLEGTLSPSHSFVEPIPSLKLNLKDLEEFSETFTLEELFCILADKPKASKERERERPISSFYEEVEEGIRQGRLQQVGLSHFRFAGNE
jgi:hypothetical protein